MTLAHRRHTVLIVRFEQILDTLAIPNLKLSQRERLYMELLQIDTMLRLRDQQYRVAV